MSFDKADVPVSQAKQVARPRAWAPSLFRRRYLESIDDMILSRNLCRLHFDGILFGFGTDRPHRAQCRARDG